MAPITATTQGIDRQTIDDPQLVELLKRLSSYDKTKGGDENISSGREEEEEKNADNNVDVEGLVGELERWSSHWTFQELADLYEWIRPLNAIDAAIRLCLKEYPAVLLIGPDCGSKSSESALSVGPQHEEAMESAAESSNDKQSQTSSCSSDNMSTLKSSLTSLQAAESEADVNSVPATVLHALTTMLQFLSLLLRYATNKWIFNSVSELSQLLAAADDHIAALALEVLANLAAPPLSHRLPGQETMAHTTVLHAPSSQDVHSRLMTLARGWGSKGCGLGLLQCVTTDDSASGQGSLPRFAGEVVFEFLPPPNNKETKSQKVVLLTDDVFVAEHNSEAKQYDSISVLSSSPSTRQNEKRRKMSGGNSVGIFGSGQRQTKSTASLFFQCLERQIGGRSRISRENLFALLAHIRLAVSFHSQASRTAAVERRLRALIATLYANPQPALLMGYFQAQPELCNEIADLIRPIVSAAAVSATGIVQKRCNVVATNSEGGVGGDYGEKQRNAAIASIVDPATTVHIPYTTRYLALETLTAIVARKDESSSSGLSQVARLTNVLGELGIGKGQFLGLLPTLVRYSLASLNLFLSAEESQDETDVEMNEKETGGSTADTPFDVEELGLDLGLTFLEATKSYEKQNRCHEEAKALEFVETVLSLASSIISVTTGTASLTDCGLIPALVSTISLISNFSRNQGHFRHEMVDSTKENYLIGLLKFILSQSIQVLEGAIITHNPALIAFHDLNGVDLLVTLLDSQFSETLSDNLPGRERNTNVQITLDGSTRVVLFSILNCLTIVFHHQETDPRSNNAPMSPADVLRRPDMTMVLKSIISHVSAYGGVLGALAITLLSDVMNSDPRVVHYVYDSGLADAIFKMLKGSHYNVESSAFLDERSLSWHDPDIPTSSELIMSIPNVIIALALTEDGRKRMLRVNPIPELLSVLCSPRFSMPNTRCMLNDMASLIGSGLDELMRHVPESKGLVIKAVVSTIKRISISGKRIVDREENGCNSCNEDSSNSRISLMHFASNISQALEHVLQNEENCSDFVKEGGVRAILDLYPLLVLRGSELLSHISCQSSPSMANLSHSTAATSLLAAIKRTAVNHNPSTVIEQIMESFTAQLSNLKEATIALRAKTKAPILLVDTKNLNECSDGLNASGILENIPTVTINCMAKDDINGELLRKYSKYLLEVINTEWLSQFLSEVISVCSHRFSPDLRSFDANGRNEWKKKLTSPAFRTLLKDLTILYRTGISEVSRIRSNVDYDRTEGERRCDPGYAKCHPARYRLRIVCADGAVIRDGIDIDCCHNVGNLEMGEEITAFERIINRSGVMRYRTARGWVSEQTRGHGREPISEVVEVYGIATTQKSKDKDELKNPKLIGYGISDLRSVGASILARIQNSQCNLYTSLSRLTMACVKTRTTTQQSLMNPQIAAVVREIGEFNRGNFLLVQRDISEAVSILGKNGVAMYFGNVLNIFHSCIYEERRDKQYLNVIVLCNCLFHDGLHDSFLLSSTDEDKNMQREQYSLPEIGFYAAIRVVISYSLETMKDILLKPECDMKQRLNRAVASSFPSALSLLRRLSSQSLLIDPPLTSYLQKLNKSDFCSFLFDSTEGKMVETDETIFSFRHSTFARSVHCQIGAITQELIENKDLIYCPPFILNSVVSLLREVLTCLEDSTKKTPTSDDTENFRNRVHRAISTALESNSGNELGSFAVNNPSNDYESSTESRIGIPGTDKKDYVAQNFEARLMVMSQDYFNSFKDSLMPMALNLIENAIYPEGIAHDRLMNNDLDDKEATTIVLSSFILDFCKKYEDQQHNIVNDILTKLLSATCTNHKGRFQVDDKKASKFASLCHALVLLLRAMPKMRIHALQRNITSIVVQCLRGATSKVRLLKFKAFPPWVTPALLFIEVMAQPMVLPTDKNEKELELKVDESRKQQKTSDYEKVCSCHKKRQSATSQTAKRISFALSRATKMIGKKDEVRSYSKLTAIPSFAPLLSLEGADHSLSICLQLLRCRQNHKKQTEAGNVENAHNLPPEAAHATVLLLTKILVIQKVASRFLRSGGVELLLGLKAKSRFQGHISLITSALRLVMEDDNTLQMEMEIEIRNTLSKLLKKQNDPNGIPLLTFVNTVRHLICRDPVSFLKSVATSISIKNDVNETNAPESFVTLLPVDVRSKNSKILNDFFRSNLNADKRNDDGQKKPSKLLPKSSAETLPKLVSSKKACDVGGKTTNHHSHNTSKRDKLEKISQHGPSTSYVPNYLLVEAIKSFQVENENIEKHSVPFLFVFEYLDILCDLLLAIPSCSNAICTVKVPSVSSKRKGDNCTILSCLLQTFLPQKRDFPNNHTQEASQQQIENSTAILQRQKSYARTKIAQSTARLLVALVARVGEGRRRVILELAIALNSCPDMNENNTNEDLFMNALQSWGDLCLGFAAPRKLSSNLHDSSLSFEVLRVMSEHGMAHAMLNALNKIRLDHPLAAITAASLLKPLEIFTRPSVVDALQEIVPKSAKKISSDDSQSSVKCSDVAGNTDCTSFIEGVVEEGMLADGFEADYASSQPDILAEDGLLEDEYESASSDDETNNSEDESDSRSTDSDEVDDEDEMQSSSDSEPENDDMSMGEETESVEELGVIDDNEEDISESESENEDETFQMDFDDDFHGQDDDQNDEYNEDDEEIEEDFVVDDLEDEGWTNIDSDGLFGTRNSTHIIARPREGNLMIETATSMLTNFLRSGEIEMEALADIEQGLSFRWPSSGRGESEQPRFRIRTLPLDRSDIGRTTLGERIPPNNATGDQNFIGPAPVILQRSLPDIGFSSISGVGRSNDTNFMDYLFSGPIFGASGAYYDVHLSGVEDDRQSSNLTLPATLDVELFPGGPSACTQANTSTSPHPLIAGVTLPPVNALISINRSIDNLTASRQRRSNDFFREWWPEFFSNVRGNVIRLHTSPTVNQNQLRVSSDAATSNGVLLDHSATEFSRAFGSTLIEMVSHSHLGDRQEEEQPGPSDINNGTLHDQDEVCDGNEVLNNNGTDSLAGNGNENSSAERDVDMTEVPDVPLVNQGDANNEAVPAENSGSIGHADIDEVNNALLSRCTAEIAPVSNPQHTELAENITESRPALSETQVGDTSADHSQPEIEESQEQEFNGDAVVCPPGVDSEVFSQLPVELQQEIMMQHESTAGLALQLDAASSLDPDALAALPEEMRQEIIEQERNERRLREQQQDEPADPSRAEDLDPASFIASLAPDLREDILMTADNDFLNSLPPDILAEARLLRERALVNRHRSGLAAVNSQIDAAHSTAAEGNEHNLSRQHVSVKRKNKTKIRVDCNRLSVTFIPKPRMDYLGPLITPVSMKGLLDLMFLLSPVRPQRLLQKVLQNICFNSHIRKATVLSLISLLDDKSRYAIDVINTIDETSPSVRTSFSTTLLGAAALHSCNDLQQEIQVLRKNHSTSALAIARNLPLSAKGSPTLNTLPSVVVRRIIGTLLFLTKNGNRLSVDILGNFGSPSGTGSSCLDVIIGLLAKSSFSMSSSNLNDLLGVIENICAPLSCLPLNSSDSCEPSTKEIEAAVSSGKEFVTIPRATVSPVMLKMLCSVLRLESCKDTLFTKVNNVTSRLSRVESNRKHLLTELASVAHELGNDAIRDLRSLRIRLDAAVQTHNIHMGSISQTVNGPSDNVGNSTGGSKSGTPSSAVTLSTNTIELKLLRVLQLLHSLCFDSNGSNTKRNDEIPCANDELVSLLKNINLDALWDYLDACLGTVSVLEGVSKLAEEQDKCTEYDYNENIIDDGKGSKKLQNSVVGLLTRFLPTIEAFFTVNACVLASSEGETRKCKDIDCFVGGQRLIKFISTNKVLLNALLRSNPTLLDKGFKVMVLIPRCNAFLDFDVKRFWFKQQVRKLRSQASRRHGSLRLTIRRDHVFEDAYRQLRLRTADEMRGRLHVTFVNEEGVDAGGLSREFFGILAKEIFNPNYALFTSTEDGCTFQPNPQSGINRDHLDYFRFVGRIVGKAVADGFLLDAHFTRSLYKHMLGLQPTYHDMQAIDPDYYKNLKMILDYQLEDIGLDLTFSTVTHWFGRSQVVDLVENGRNISVTDQNKNDYVNLVCQHRMTTAIEKQIKAYLDGFYDLVKRDLIAIFSPKELELLISGLPDIDVSDLKQNTEYHGYRITDKEIVWFWNIMFSLTKSEKAAFLQFVTGSSKVPLNGFSDLQGMRGTQKFSIHKASLPAGSLMAAHTCFNSLDLPSYDNENEMKDKLLYAIKEGGGSFQFA